MKKRVVVGVIVGGLLLQGMINAQVLGSINNAFSRQSTITNSIKTNDTVTQSKTVPENLSKNVLPICDGINVKSNCTVDTLEYKTYIFHPAVPEKSHNEIVTTYQDEITGYCTLCVDGTYSPSCATGKGACSHHGGVSQWNAPIVTKVPVTSTKKVLDSSAQAEYYEKVSN